MKRCYTLLLVAILAAFCTVIASPASVNASPTDSANLVCQWNYHNWDGSPFTLSWITCYHFPGWFADHSVQPPACKPLWVQDTQERYTEHVEFRDHYEFYNTNDCGNDTQVMPTPPEVPFNTQIWALNHLTDGATLDDGMFIWQIQKDDKGTLVLVAIDDKGNGSYNRRYFTLDGQFTKTASTDS